MRKRSRDDDTLAACEGMAIAIEEMTRGGTPMDILARRTQEESLKRKGVKPVFPKGGRARFLKGDCSQRLGEIPDSSIDLVFTSPPYAEQRKHDYGGIPADKYVEWFLPISLELKRVLKPTGSFVLNIKENVEDHARSSYVYELVLTLSKDHG